jgi:hypothetical protein
MERQPGDPIRPRVCCSVPFVPPRSGARSAPDLDTAPLVHRSARSATNLGALFGLYALEASCVLIAIVLHKDGGASVRAVLTRRYSLYALAASAGALASIGLLIASFRGRNDEGRRVFWLSAAMNLVTVLMAFTVAETAIRLLSSRTPAYVVIAGTKLLPRSWPATVARYRKLLHDVPSDISYFVPDTLLGWTLGPNRRSKDGMYSSSAEAIRSPHPDTSYAAERPRYRIALVGDSYTFGMDVTYEQSWARQLERALGPEFQVLDFGIDGYGVDQSYLRYVRDVRPWHPDVAVLGFAGHDLERTLSVYVPVTYPEWGFPFEKPRFTLRAGKLTLLNVPLMTPESLLSTPSVSDLPFVTYDQGYNPQDWQPKWYYASYVVRLLFSKFPYYSPPSVETSRHTLRLLNTTIMTSFARLSAAEGSVPLILYTPDREDFVGFPRRPVSNRMPQTAVLRALRERGIEYEDLTSCLVASHEPVIFVPGHRHYSPAGSAAVAACLRPVIAQLASERAR